MSTVYNKYSGLTIDDLYHPTLVQIYFIYSNVSLCVTTVFFIFMLYVILKKSSTEMKGYRLYLIHQLIWSVSFQIHLMGWKPVTLWPFSIGYSIGWYSNIPKEYAFLPVVGVAFIVFGMIFSIYISMVHTHVKSSPLSRWYKMYSILSLRLSCYVVIFMAFECAVCIPFWMLRRNIDKTKNIIISQAEYMKFFFDRYPNIFGFALEVDEKNTIMFMWIVIPALSTVIISVVLLYIFSLKALRKNKKILTVTTYRMQITMFKTICVQGILLFCLFIIPIMITLFLAVLNVKWVSKFALFTFIATSIHAVANFVTIIYFIKPYKMFLLRCINKLLKLLGFGVLTPPSKVFIKVTSTVLR